MVVGTIACLYILTGILVAMFLEHSYNSRLIDGSEDKYLTNGIRAELILLWPLFIWKLIQKLIEYYGSDNDDNEPGFGY